MQERVARIAEGPATAISKAAPVLLFRGLDGGRRALRLAVVDRIEEVPAWAVRESAGQLRVQLGESILPLAGTSATEIGNGKVRLFRLNDGLHEIGYAFGEVIDFATIEHDIIHSERPGEISGVSLVNNEPAELVDAHWLFANHAARSEQRAVSSFRRLPSAVRRGVGGEQPPNAPIDRFAVGGRPPLNSLRAGLSVLLGVER